MHSPHFALGDMVTWESQANGVTKTKTGTIVGIVPAKMTVGRHIDHVAALHAQHYDASALGWSCARYQVSYLVAVSMVSRTGKRRPRQRLYWPRVASLRPVEATS